MIEIKSWAAEFAQKLQDAFGPRLLFVGYQGSYGRGEATPESDIDTVAVLDEVTTEDLDLYRSLVRAMPHGELACGFICGEKELAAWPRYDLYGLVLDTKAVLGDLTTLTPRFTQEDAREALRIGTANLYHAACHTFLYNDSPETVLPALLKSAFFCLRMFAQLRYGVWHATKRDLATVLTGQEKELLALVQEPERLETRQAYRLLLEWCGTVLRKSDE